MASFGALFLCPVFNTPRKTVGASLLAIAVVQPTSSLAEPPLSRASPAPTGLWCTQVRQTSRKTVGASLPAMTPAQPTSSLAEPPLSRASPAPTGSVVYTSSANIAGNCGSGLARDGVGTTNIFVDCPTAIASRLAPTGLCSRLDVIQRLIHRQLSQHHHLRNTQQSLAMGAFQQRGEVTEHDRGRGQ